MIRSVIFDFFGVILGNSAVDSEVLGIVRSLQNDYSLGLLSNASSREYLGSLSGLRLETLFDAVVVSGEVGVGKPNTEIYVMIMNQLGAAPSETVFIDDNSDFVVAAADLGMHGILFESSGQLANDLESLGLTVR